MAESKKGGKTRDKTPSVSVGRARKTGDLDALRRMHWLAVRTAYRAMKEARMLDEQLSCIHALNQSSGSYSKLLEKTDLQNEIDELRKQLAELRESPSMRKVI